MQEAQDRHRDLIAHSNMALILVVEGYHPNVKVIISQMSSLPFFSEIVLFQEDGKEEKEFVKLRDASILPMKYIVSEHSPRLRKFSKWQACFFHATAPACFYQSLHYDTFGYIEALHTQYTKRKDVIHAALDPITLYHDSQLLFISKEHGVNAGFAFMDYGAIWPNSGPLGALGSIVTILL